MITIDEALCTGCGACARICHERCISLVDGRAAIDRSLCSTCAQCVAICPEQALSWRGVPPLACDPARLPSPEQLDELLKERRSIRAFKPDKLDRALLAEVVGYGGTAPTNNYGLRAIVVDDDEIIALFDRAIMQFIDRIYRLIFKPRLVFNAIRLFTPGLDPKIKVKIEEGLARGYAVPHPPAIVLIAGDRRIPLSPESAQCALCHMYLYAQSKGLAACLWGNAQVVIDRSRTARRRLGLPGHEHILGGLMLGYPATRFRNKVEGKALSIQWNEAQSSALHPQAP